MNQTERNPAITDSNPTILVTGDRPADLEPGQAVRVTEGPLAGVEGIVTAKNARDRVDVLLAIVGQSTRTRLPASQVAGIEC